MEKRGTSGQVGPKCRFALEAAEQVAFFISVISIGGRYMTFFTSAINTLQTLVIALGAGLAVWGIINLLEGYGLGQPSGKKSRGQAAHGWRRRHSFGYDPDPLLSGLF